MRDRASWSVTAKIATAFILLSLVFAILLLVNSYLTHQLIGASSAIKHAGSQRMRVFKIAFLLNEVTASDEEARRMVEEQIRQIDAVITWFQEGNAAQGILQENDPDVTSKLAAIEREWTGEMKPALEHALRAPSRVAAAPLQYNQRVFRFVGAWSEIVDTLERRTTRRIDLLYRLQFSFLLCAGLLLAGAMVAMRRVVQDPLKKLIRGAEAMAQGQLPISVGVRTQDEFGRLAAAFEWMAGRIRQHLDHLEALRLTGQEITMLETGGLEQVLRRIADRAADLLKADLAILLVRHPILECWVIEAASGHIFDAVRKQVLLFEETPLTTQVFETRAPIFVNDLSAHADKRIRFRDEFGAKSYMAVPVFGPHELLGVLVLLQTSTVRTFTDWDVQLTQQFCSYAAVAIENARLLEAVEAESSDVKERLRTAERRIADLTHEVKAPAGRVAEFAAWLIGDYGAKLDERAIRYLHWIQKEGRDLSDLAERTLDIARLSQERRELESVDVASVVREVVDLHAGALATKRIQVEIQDGLPHVACRRIHVKQMFENLIDNAIKYMRDQPSPRITVGAEEGLLFVRDNGVGIDPSMTERIFQPFQRLGTVDAPGAGLGLSIVKTVVEHYGGEVTVSSIPGGGSTFYLRLPILLREHGSWAETESVGSE